MTNPSEDLLATTEGVDEGSAASTVEGAEKSTEELTGVTNPVKRALGDGPDRDASPDAVPAAAPVDMESEESRGARESAPGQQYEVGEG